MVDDVLKTEELDKNRILAEEILNHAEFLMDSSLTRQQRDRLARIRISAQGLAANLQQEDTADPSSQGEESAAGHPEKSPIPPLKILLAEDNPFTQKLMSRLLLQNNHTVDIAANGEAVLEKLPGNNFDLILMDIRMPVMDGIEAAKAIREKEKTSGEAKIPIIAVTALVEEADKNNIFESGIDGYHGKPIRAKILDQEIARVLQITSTDTDMKQRDSEPETPLVSLDIERLLKTVDNDWSLIREITQLFFSDAPKQMARIKQAIETEDPDELLEASHSLKGAAGAFGNNLVYDIAYELEQLGRSKTISSAAEEYHNLLKEALAAMDENLQTILAENGD
jgi:two-component system, sensor histidine kinase and response regulator